MNLDEIKKILDENLNKEPFDGKKRNIIFWYDSEGEFVEDIDELELANAKILKLSDNNSFYIKYLLEKEDMESNYLIYSPNSKPLAGENWLLDILKYSGEFFTDKATVIMRDFGVVNENLRKVFKKYIKFFGNKERYRKFASFKINNYTEEKVDTAVLSALCRLSIADFEQVVKSVLIEKANDKDKYIEDIRKYGDKEAFWNIVHKKYGYELAEKELEQLMIMFTITDLSYSLEEKIPNTWERYISTKKADAIVFTNHFINHSVDSEYYDILANKIEKKIKLKDYIKKWDIDKFIKCETYKAFDEEIILRLINHLVDNIGEYEKYRKIINRRKPTHWYKKFKYEYEAIYYAMEILRLESELEKTIKGNSAYELFENYTKEYYLFDYFYRKFFTSYDEIENKEQFAELTEIVENTYAHWYLEDLSIKWSRIIEDELKDDIEIKGFKHQKDFYKHYISPYVGNNERVFVIISDGLRYEAAKEVCDVLNTEVRGAVNLSFAQGVIPSYTKLGMASLLPHKNIELNDKSEVIIDGINSKSTENRQRVLLNYSKDALAIQYKDMIDYKPKDYEIFKGKKLIYIYHNVIDALGDKSITEKDVFKGVERTINDIKSLIKNLVNRVSATNIYVTADHGFIYRRKPLNESDKIPKSSAVAIDKNRRFIISKDTEDMAGTLNIPMNYILGKDSDLNTIVPKGVIRFKVQGSGENYVHGGAALQEIVIPVVEFKNIRKDEFKSTKVKVQMTNISRKITNRITYLEFFQTEKVEDKKTPIRLKLYFVDEEGNRISNENIIIADSRSSKPEERTYREKFTLKDLSYDKAKKYYLILEDEDETVEKIYEKIPFIIDLAITDDFGF